MKPKTARGPWGAVAEVRQHAALVWLILRDAAWRFRYSLAMIAGARGAGLACQFVALGLVYTYIRKLESSQAIRMLGFAIDGRSTAALLIVGALGAMLLVLSAILDYAGDRWLVVKRQDYEEACYRRVVALAGYLPHPRAPRANAVLARDEFARLSRTGSRACGRGFQSLLTIGHAAVKLLVAAGLLFYISAPLSLAIFVVLALTPLMLYRITRRVLRASRLPEQEADAASIERNRLLERLWYSPGPIAVADRALTEMFAGGATRRLRDAEIARRLAIPDSRRTINLIAAVVLVGVLLYLGSGVLAGRWSVSLSVAYLGALQYFMAGVMGAGGAVAKAGRFTPDVERYFDFVGDSEVASRPDGVAPYGRPVRLALGSLSDGGSTLTLCPGRPAHLVYPGPVDRQLVALLQQRTLPDDDGASATYWFISQAADADITLHDGLLAAVHSRRAVLIITTADLDTLRAEWTADAASLLADRVLLVASREPPPATGDGKAIVLVGDGEDLTGWCSSDWLAAHPEIVTRAKKTTHRRGADDLLDVEDDDDESDML